MENTREDLDNLINDVKDYAETRIALGKLKTIDKGTQIAGVLTVGVFVSIFILLFLFFISITVALVLATLLGKLYLGFLIVGSTYLLLGLLVYLKRDSWIRIPISNFLIKNFFKDIDDGN